MLERELVGNIYRVKLRAGRRAVVLCGILLSVMCGKSNAYGQILVAHEPRPSFEVATIKPSKVNADSIKTRMFQGSFTAEHASLKNLLRYAYRVKTDDELVGLPDWAENAYFDVNAKVDDQTAQNSTKLPLTESLLQTRLRVQTLLSERFHLVVTTRYESLKVYCLTTTKGAPKVKEVVSSTAIMGDAPTSGEAAPPPPPVPLPGSFSGGVSPLDASQSYQVIGRAASMDMLTQWISSRPEVGSRTVLNQTGLRGRYDFRLTDLAPLNMDVSAQPGTGHASIFTLLREQLGLQLVLRNARVQVLVVREATRPSEN